jgi:hypothetical protein
MEFFIPGLLIFIVAIALSFLIAPRATPLIASLLSIGFLTFGVYEHYKMFASEYRLSTWQDGLKIYAPAIMIGAILIFIIYAILAFFTKGSVPVPQMPTITAPSENSITNSVMKTVNNVVNSLKVNKNKNEENKNKNEENENENEENENKNEERVSRSLFETL